LKTCSSRPNKERQIKFHHREKWDLRGHVEGNGSLGGETHTEKSVFARGRSHNENPEQRGKPQVRMYVLRRGFLRFFLRGRENFKGVLSTLRRPIGWGTILRQKPRLMHRQGEKITTLQKASHTQWMIQLGGGGGGEGLSFDRGQNKDLSRKKKSLSGICRKQSGKESRRFFLGSPTSKPGRKFQCG